MDHGEKLGLKYHERWTAEETTTLRAGVAAGESWETIAGKLPGRNWCMAKHRARWLGIERSEKQVPVAWTEAEDAEVRAGVAAGETTAAIAGRLPGRTVNAVRKRRAALREGERPVVERWTEREDAALREGFESGTKWKEVAEQLQGRTMNAAAARATKRLGLKRDDSKGSAEA
jgi:hypothetical protein